MSKPDTHGRDFPSESTATVISHLRFQLMRTRARVAVAGLLLVITSAGVGALFAREPHVRVLVAAHDLAGDVVITHDDVSWQSLPRSAVPRHALTHTASAVGRRLSGSIAGGDALSTERFEAIPKNRSALHVTISVDAATANALAVGDRVDVWCASAPDGISGQRVVKQAARALRVLSVSPRTSALDESAVLLAVPPSDVPIIISAQAEGAALLLTRRP